MNGLTCVEASRAIKTVFTGWTDNLSCLSLSAVLMIDEWILSCRKNDRGPRGYSGMKRPSVTGEAGVSESAIYCVNAHY